MAELGETSDPKELVPGNADAIDGNVDAIGGRGDSMELAATSLKGIDTGDYWKGGGAEAFRDVFSYEPARWYAASDAFHVASDALKSYGGTLRWAQTQAQEAIAQWDEAQIVTANAVRAYNAAVDTANATNRANAVAGNPVRIRMEPFFDPGEAGRAKARATLSAARTQLSSAGDTAASTVSAATDGAPEAPKDKGFLDQVKSFGGGVWDSVTGIADVATMFSPNRITTDPLGYMKDVGGVGMGLYHGVQDPKEFGKQMLDWDTWATDPARAAGRLVPDVALALGTGGAGTAAKKVGVDAVESAVVKDVVKEGIPLDGFRYKDSWTPDTSAVMDRKMSSFNDMIGPEGFAKELDMPVRDPVVRKEFLDSLGLDKVPPGQHVDHTRDLQAGGTDTVDNMQLLDGSVNSSFGSQLKHQMDQHPPGTVFSSVDMLRE